MLIMSTGRFKVAESTVQSQQDDNSKVTHNSNTNSSDTFEDENDTITATLQSFSLEEEIELERKRTCRITRENSVKYSTKSLV